MYTFDEDSSNGNVLISENGCLIEGETSGIFMLADIFDVKFEEWDNEKTLKGYKEFFVQDDDTLKENSVYGHNKDISFEIGQWSNLLPKPARVEITKPTHISRHAKNTLFEVEFYASDIDTTLPHNVVKVKKLKVAILSFVVGVTFVEFLRFMLVLLVM